MKYRIDTAKDCTDEYRSLLVRVDGDRVVVIGDVTDIEDAEQMVKDLNGAAGLSGGIVHAIGELSKIADGDHEGERHPVVDVMHHLMGTLIQYDPPSEIDEDGLIG